MAPCGVALSPPLPRAGPWLRGTLLVVALFWIADLGLLRAGTPYPLDDTWEYGVAARHVMTGAPWRTNVIHPPLWSLRDPVTGTVPVLVHGPLVPLLMVPVLAACGPAALDQTAWMSALFAWLAALFIFRLGARRISTPVGAAAALLWTCSPLTLRAVHHDVTLTAGAALLALALDLLERDRPRALAAGLALGAGALARPEFLLALVLVLPLARRGAWRVTLAAALAVWAPWGWHTWRAAGSPLYNLSSYLLIGYTESRWAHSVLRDFTMPPAVWPRTLLEALPTLPDKWAHTFLPAVKAGSLAPTGGTGWLVLPGLGMALAAPALRRLAAVAAALAMVPVAILTLAVPDSRYLVPFLPLWALAAAWGAASAARLLPVWARRPRAWMGLLLLLVLPSLGPAMRTAAVESHALQTELARARALLEPLRAIHGVPGEPIAPLFTDRPDLAAWTTGRSAVWLTRAEYERLPRVAATEAGAPRRASPAIPSREDGVPIWFGED